MSYLLSPPRLTPFLLDMPSVRRTRSSSSLLPPHRAADTAG
jgi:hypothetical protein